MTLKQRRLDYKWIVLATCFLMEFLCLGFCSSNVGLYTKAVTVALNIKRSVYALAQSIRYVTQVVTALYFGTMIQRFGVKKTVCVGLVSLTASVAIRACATHVVHLYIGSVFWGIGIIFSGGSMAGLIVRRWFSKDVGRYTGIVMSANGIGGAIAAQIISPIINNGETFGYRKAYLLSAGIALVITVLVVIFLREKPEGADDAVPVPGKRKPKGSLWAGAPYDVVRRKPYFYATAVLVFLTGISLQSIGSISVVYMTDLGFSSEFIATSATISSLCLTGTKVLVGAAYDKKGLGFSLLMCQMAAIVAFIIRSFLVNTTAGMVMALTASTLGVIAIPMETVMISLLAGDLFGKASYEKVLSVFMAMNALGLCLGSPLGELYYDLLGTYKPCFWFFAALMVAVAVGYRFVIRAAYRDKEAILAGMQ